MHTRRSVLQSLFATAALSTASIGRASCSTAAPVVEFFFEGGLNVGQSFMVSTDTADGDRTQVGASSVYNLVSPSLVDRAGTACYDRTNVLDPLVDHQIPFRVLELGHELMPHEAAIPYAYTGTTLGRPNHAGTAVHVSAACGGTQVVLFDDRILSPTPPELRALGLHDASAAPFVVQFGAWGVGNTALLQRQPDPYFDPLLGHYNQRYGERLAPQGRPRVASDGYDAYSASLQLLLGLESGAGIPYALSNVQSGTRVETAVNAVQSLLATTSVQYVAVVLGDFDTHGLDGAASVEKHNAELHDLLMEVKDHRNDALGSAVIAITTEFGRYRKSNDEPSEHFPERYGNLIIPPAGTAIDSSFQVADRFNGDLWRPFDLRAYLLSHFGLSDQDVVAALGSFPDASTTELTTARVAAITAALTT